MVCVALNTLWKKVAMSSSARNDDIPIYVWYCLQGRLQKRTWLHMLVPVLHV